MADPSVPGSAFPGGPAASSPFSVAMGQAKSATEEFSRMFSEMRLPAMPGMDVLVNAHRRNIEAMSNANRIALEGAQAVAKRHMEIVQQTMAELSDTVRSLGTPDAPQAKAARQTDLLKQAYEKAVANTRELSELIQRANGEALEQLNRRFVEAMDEVKQLVDKSPGKTAPPG